jgi:hypothetical protein
MEGVFRSRRAQGASIGVDADARRGADAVSARHAGEVGEWFAHTTASPTDDLRGHTRKVEAVEVVSR